MWKMSPNFVIRIDCIAAKGRGWRGTHKDQLSSVLKNDSFSLGTWWGLGIGNLRLQIKASGVKWFGKLRRKSNCTK